MNKIDFGNLERKFMQFTIINRTIYCIHFKTVQLTCNGIGIEWINGQYMAPHELYDNYKPYSNFDEQIFKELSSYGFEGKDLFSAFEHRKQQINLAVQNLKSELKVIADNKTEYFTYEDLFD